MSVIIGVDPGSRVTGYGVIDDSGRQPIYVASGVIKVADQPFPRRLKTIYQSISDLIREYAPQQFAIEQVFVGKSASSALKLGHARGVAILAAEMAGLEISEYAARSIKQAVSGSGAADKQQMQDMIVRLLNLNSQPTSDSADALSVALCHAYSRIALSERAIAQRK